MLALNTSKEEEDNRYVSSNKWIIFHMVFVIAALTLPWVLYQSGESFHYTSTGVNEWVRMLRFYRIMGWFMIMGVYIWTLVAARLYPEQDFDELENYFKEFELN